MTEPAINPRQATTVCDEVRLHGALGVETGGFLLTSDNRSVSHIALAGLADIERDWGRFVIGRAAIDRLFTHAENHELRVAAMFHSHMHEAFLSPIDRTGGINMTGFTSIVIPNFTNPPSAVIEWGFWTFNGHDWIPRPSWPTANTPSTSVLRFDADGVTDA